MKKLQSGLLLHFLVDENFIFLKMPIELYEKRNLNWLACFFFFIPVKYLMFCMIIA